MASNRQLAERFAQTLTDLDLDAFGELLDQVRIAAPINHQLTRAAAAHETPVNARALQKRSDRIIGTRVALQTTALALLVSVLAFS